MSERIYTDLKGHEEELARQVKVLVTSGLMDGDPYALVVFEREEAADDATPSRAYLQPVLFSGSVDDINAAIEDFMSPDGDGDITLEAWLEAYHGIDPVDIDFDND
jgi:hypothetical protein